ncbi:MAG: SDR family NAD(P)-dependent oxidoreductase, partial [Gammaproteobacteria bacterium]
TDLTHRFLGPMIERGEGAILNVASTAAFQPGPNMAVYYASKSYVLSFTEALAYELKPSGVKVSALCPGPTLTGFQARADMEDARLVTMLPSTSAEQVAKAGYEGLRKGKRVIIPGFGNALTARTAPLLPAFVKLPLVRYLQT